MKTKLPEIKKEEYIRIYRSLPADVKVSVLSEETADKMKEIREKHSISDDDFGTLLKITGRVMLGMIELKSFIRTIVASSNLKPEAASAIAKSINQDVFQSVRESMMKIHEVKHQLTGDLPTKTKHPLKPIKEIVETSPGRPTQVAPPPKQKAQEEPIRPIPPAPMPKSITKPEPVALSEIEKRSPAPTPAPTLPPKKEIEGPRMPSDLARQEAEKRREALIQKLKKTSPQQKVTITPPNSTTSKKLNTGQNEPPRSSRFIRGEQNVKEDKPKPVTTAWNGRTIDLRKIPPRRVSPKKPVGESMDIIEV